MVQTRSAIFFTAVVFHMKALRSKALLYVTLTFGITEVLPWQKRGTSIHLEIYVYSSLMNCLSLHFEILGACSDVMLTIKTPPKFKFEIIMCRKQMPFSRCHRFQHYLIRIASQDLLLKLYIIFSRLRSKIKGIYRILLHLKKMWSYTNYFHQNKLG